MASATSIAEHIDLTPGTCGGKPRIAGQRITVQNIVVCHERMGLSPDEILSVYPTITLADVYAALAYYLDHIEEIRDSIRQEDDGIRELEASQPSVLDRLGRRNASAKPL